MKPTDDLYEILELDSSCSATDIKKAYRRLAMLHHPDKNPDASHETFQAIQGAYEILSDPDQRASYDRYGLSGVNGQGGYGDDSDGVDMDDFFASMFGHGFPSAGMGGGGFYGASSSNTGKRKRKTRGDDQVLEFEVTLEECFTGKERHLELEKGVICPACKGNGRKAKAQARYCARCKGKGTRVEETMLAPGFVTRKEGECRDCDGTGETFRPQDACKKCKGAKVIKQKNEVNLFIDRGSRSGDRIVLRGEGEQYPEQQPGDIILQLRIAEHPSFSLVPGSLDLQTQITLTLSEALLGFNRLILTHLDGRGLVVDQPPPGRRGFKVFKTGDIVRIQGEGFPKRKSELRGDLLAKITVEMPTAQQMNALAETEQLNLEKLLPAKRPAVIQPEVTDEVALHSALSAAWFDTKSRSRAQERYEEPSSDDEVGSGCRQQ